MRTLSRSALIVAPHPDDETIGCGATIIRKVDAGTPVRVVVVSDGGGGPPDEGAAPAQRILARREECREACRRLGLGPEGVEFLGIEDGALNQHVPKIAASLSEVIERFAPAEVFAPAGIDAHSDHRAVAMAIGHLRSGPLAGVDVLAYPVWYWNRWAWADPRHSQRRQAAQLLWRPMWHTLTCHARRVDVHDVVEQKRYALAAHQSQVGTPGTNGAFLDQKWLESFLRPDEIFFAVQEPSRR
jgi:LmbE family N-acetylglucosaminyl deacetylase